MAEWRDTGEGVIRSEHIGPLKTGDNIDAKVVAGYVWNSTTSQWQRQTVTGGRIVTVPFDYIAYTDTSATVDTYTYYTGGSGGTLVATVTILYTDSTKTQPSTITRT